MATLLIHGGTVINEGVTSVRDILIKDGFFCNLDEVPESLVDERIDAHGLWVLPGIIDDQVHFREPGLETRGTIASESRAAVAGGITSYMEMPNTIPPAVTIGLVEEKMKIAAERSWCNYSFYLGATNDNLEEIKKITPEHICGLKVFMGSSTGNLLVDDPEALHQLFLHSPVPVAVHSEDEETIIRNLQIYREMYGEDPNPSIHALIRSEEACVKCTQRALAYCEATGGHLHLLHLSTAREVALIREAKKAGLHVTAEVCVHHLYFSDQDYAHRGNFIKWNPSVKREDDRLELIEGLLDGTIDIVATDHAPHEYEKKAGPYFSSPSGGPMVEHSLVAMLQLAEKGYFTTADVVRWMAHQPADLFKVDRRGYIKEGYYADLVLVNPNDHWTVKGEHTQYKVRWSPLEGTEFNARVYATLVNGRCVYRQGEFFKENCNPMPLQFIR